MAMMIPQTLIMGWINAFFAGFVISTSNAASGGCPSSMAFMLTLVSPISEAPVPPYDSIQVNAAVRSRDSRSRRSMGIESVMVLPQPFRVAVCLYIHPRQ